MNASLMRRLHIPLLLLVIALAGCAQPAGPATSAAESDGISLRAGGNEPFWSLTLEGQALRFRTPDLQLAGTVSPHASASGMRLGGTVEGRAVEIRTRARVCRDSMSGMPHPHEVMVRIDTRRYSGCGGEPATLLQGSWHVVELEGGLPAGAQLSLLFDTQGRLSGRAGCNRYSSRYTLTGETLSIGPGAATRMACEPALMELEGRFLRQLETVRHFDIGERGELRLMNAQGQRIVARRG